MGRPLKSIKPMFKYDKWRIVRGDLVQIITGKDKGKQGNVLRVIRDKRRPQVVVEGLNLVTRRLPAREGQPGFPVRIESPLHYSNVMLVDVNNEKPVRTSYFFHEQDGDIHKLRVTKGKNSSRSNLPKPQPWKELLTGDTRVGPKDTPPEAALQVTYDPSSDFDYDRAKSKQRRAHTTGYGSSARGFAASALEGASCSGRGVGAAAAQQAQHPWGSPGAMLSHGMPLLGHSRQNTVLWMMRHMHSSSSSSSGSNGSSHLQPAAEATAAAALESEQRAARGTSRAWQWLQQAFW